MNDFLSLLKECRSIRIFDNSIPIPEETLLSFVEAARYGASSGNLQALKFRLVYEKNEADAVRPLTKWASALKDYNGPSDEESPSAYIVICIDSEIAPNTSVFEKDVGIAAEIMALSACEKGIGCCMIGSFSKDKISGILSIPDNLTPSLIIAFGISKQTTVLEDAADGTTYYRDENGRHHVPKRPLDGLIIK